MNQSRLMDGQIATVIEQLIAVGKVTEAHLDDLLRPVGLSAVKMWTLHQLMDEGKSVSLGRLADKLGCAKSNATQLVDRLESDGLVRRVHDAEDRRSVLAVLTDAGQERYRAALDIALPAQHELSAMFTEAERDQLSSLLTRVLCRWS